MNTTSLRDERQISDGETPQRGGQSRKAQSKRAHLAIAACIAFIGGLMTIVGATPASAGPGGTCAAGFFCVWSNNGFTGENADWFGNSSDWPGPGVCGNCVENDDQSVDNSGTQQVRVYMYQGYGTPLYCIGSGTRVTLPSYFPINNGSSHVWNTASC